MKNSIVGLMGIAFFAFVLICNLLWGDFSTVGDMRTFVLAFIALITFIRVVDAWLTE